jgi:hypothetical protein
MRRLVVLLVVVVATALASTAGTAKAGLLGGCGATAPVFAPWNDSSAYYFASNGGFEYGSTGWSLSGGAAVVNQSNEPWFVAGFGSRALQIPTGGKAAINVCYGLSYPAIRFFAAGQGGDATIHVRVISRSLLGILSILDGGTFNASQGWDPSPKVSTFLSAVASLVGTTSLQVQFTVESGTAQIDDLYVDPFLTRS